MIKRLSEDVRGRLRTGVALTGVAQCVEELVLNAVDAGSTCVAVRLDLQSLTVQVVDNGQGIGQDQLPLLGQRYSTSKCHSVDDLDNLRYFGYRGEALASLCSASSLVEIITRPPGSTTTYSKCFHKGKPLPATEPSQPRPGAGTTVTARNLFYNLPVRKKSLNEGLELEKTRFRLAGLALMWPLVSFSLRDDVTGNVILQTHKCSGILGTFASLFGSARTKHMRQVECGNDVFNISGYVSRENYSRKDLQFVFVNRRLVLKSKVHKMVNSVLGKSVLVRRRGTSGVEKNRQAGQERSYGENGSPTKLFERYAVYVINIDCSLNVYDITFDPAKTLVEFHDWPKLTGLVESMLMTFLKEENLLLPTEEVKERNEDPSSSGTAEPEISVSQTSELCETEDPFEGNDEHVDQEFHDTLQRQRYTKGISVHSNINSLFSRTVRRPAIPGENVGLDGPCPSSPKKSKLDNDRDKNTGSKRAQDNEGGEETEDTNSHGQYHKSDSKEQAANDSMSDWDETEEFENQQQEVILPRAVGPSKREVHHSSNQHTSAEKPQAEIPFSESTGHGICLPPEFAQCSSLSDLRVQAAEQRQFCSSRSSGPTGKTQTMSSKSGSAQTASSKSASTMSSKSASAVLRKFHRSGKLSQAECREVEENVDFEDETETSPSSQIVLPSVVRLPLFRSKSLDAERSCCGVRDASVQRKHCRSSSSKGSRKNQTYDDIHISYTRSSPPLASTKRGLKNVMWMDSEQNKLSGKPHKRLSDPDGKGLNCLPARFQHPYVSHQRQNDRRKEKDVRSLPHNDSTQIANKPRNSSQLFTDRAAQVHRSTMPEHSGSGLSRGCGATSKKAVSHTAQHSEASRTEHRVSGPRHSDVSRTEQILCGSRHSGASGTEHRVSGPRHSDVSRTEQILCGSRHSGASGTEQTVSHGTRLSEASRTEQKMSGTRCSEASRTELTTFGTRHSEASRTEPTLFGTRRPEASRTEQTMPRNVESYKQTSGQLPMSHTRSGPHGAVSFASKLSAAAHSSARSDHSQSSSKPGRLSQASKLAQLMRKEHAPSPENCPARTENPSDSSHCDKGEKVAKNYVTSSSVFEHNTTQNVERGQCHTTHVHTERRRHELTALEMLSSCQPPRRSRNSSCHDTQRQSASTRFPQLHLFETPQSVLKRSSYDDDGSSLNPTEERPNFTSLHLFETPRSVFSTRESLAGHAEEAAIYHSHRAQIHACTDKTVNTANGRQQRLEVEQQNIASRHQPFDIRCSSDPPASQWSFDDRDTVARRKNQLNPSGDAPHAGFCHEMDTSACQNVVTIPSFQSLSSQRGNVSEECRSSSTRLDAFHQHTQSFSALSSQGFDPHMTEAGTLPFDVNASEGAVSQSAAQTDSPLSTHSAGFSPSANDPMLGEVKSRNRINCSTLTDRTDTQISGLCSLSPSSCRMGKTQEATETDSVANSCPSQNELCQISDSSNPLFPFSQKTTQSVESSEEKIASDSWENAEKSGKAEQNLQQHRLSVERTHSQQFRQCSQKAREFHGTGQSVSSLNAAEVLPDPAILMRDEKQSSLSTHQLPPNNIQSETRRTDSQAVVSGKINPTGMVPPTISSMSITSDVSSPDVGSPTAGSSVISPSETMSQVSESTLTISSLTVSNHPQGQGSRPSPSPPDCVEGRREERCETESQSRQTESKLIRVRETAEQKELSKKLEQAHDEHKESSHILEGENSVHEPLCHNEREHSNQDTGMHSSENQPVKTSQRPCEGSSYDDKREIKRKLSTDQTFDSLPISARKKTRPSDLVESAHTSARQAGVFSVSIPSSSAKPVSSDETVEARTLSDPSRGKIESSCGSQQTDVFSDSVPVSALASIAMPASQSPASLGVVSSADSLPDSVIANITFPEKMSSDSASKTSLSQDSVTDSVLADVSMQETQDEPRRGPCAVTGDRLADASLGDASVADASVADASVADTSLADASVADVSVADASVADASVADASVADASVADASVADASVADASMVNISANISITQDPQVSPQNWTSVCFTQNAYNLGLSTSSTPGLTQPGEEDLNLTAYPTSSDTQCPNVPTDDDTSADKNLGYVHKNRTVSEGVVSKTALRDTAVGSATGDVSKTAIQNVSTEHAPTDEGSNEKGSDDRNDIRSDGSAVKEVGGGGEEGQMGARSEGDGVKEVAWLPVTHPFTGSVVYMNSGSGHTLTLAQWNQRKLAQTTQTGHSAQVGPQKQNLTTSSTKTPDTQTSKIEELSPLSHDTLGALLSRHLEEEEREAQSKWREGSRVTTETSDGGETVSDILSAWANPVFKKPEQVLQTSSRSQAGRRARCFFPPTAFTKSMLTGAKVIGQLDNKFVACLIQEDQKTLPPSTSYDAQGHVDGDSENHEGGLVVLFDQHAAHERIRLEQLLADVYEKEEGAGKREEKRIKRCDVQPPRTVDLSEEDVRLMQTFREELDRIGVKFSVDKERRDRVHAHTIPACMAQREANDRKRGKDPLSYEYLQIMIKEHNQLLLSTAGARQQLPQQVHRLLATHACKGAIKFGDSLSLSTCRELLSSLSSCDLPFQCAHGRPSIAPILSLTQLRQAAPETKRLPRLWKLQKQNRTDAQNQESD